MRLTFRLRFAAALLLISSLASADVTLKIRNTFVNTLKDKATYSRWMKIDRVSSKHSQADDGEYHISCIGASTGLNFATVAELTNPQGTTIINQIKSHQNGAGSINLKGVWRFWSEHGDGTFSQQTPVALSGSSNPNHLFELHPLTKVGNTDIRATSFQPIPGYSALDTHSRTRNAFTSWEAITCTVTRNSTWTTIYSQSQGRNFVRFDVELLSPPTLVNSDLMRVWCRVSDWESPAQELSPRCLMVVTRGTPPEQFLAGRTQGFRARLVGFPRMSLYQIKQALDNSNPFEGKLPYEMVVVAVDPTQP